MHLDKATKEGLRFTFVKICVEMDLSKPLLDKILMEVDDGQPFKADVEYGWKPLFYTSFSQLGHDQFHCKMKNPVQNFV